MDEPREKGGRTPGDALRLWRGEESVAGETQNDLLCKQGHTDGHKKKLMLQD